MDGYRLEADVLKAIAHPVRLQILNALRDDEECVCHLTALLKRRQAYVSQQLMFLRQAGLIEDRKDGWRVYYRIKNRQVIDILDALNEFVGAKRTGSEAKILAACPCPKCERDGHGEGGKELPTKAQIGQWAQ